MTNKKTKPEIFEMIKVCPGKRHAWYNSSLGFPIRKPFIRYNYRNFVVDRNELDKETKE